eukprot:1839552-Pleurochrysis_carterae.AAC.1
MQSSNPLPVLSMSYETAVSLVRAGAFRANDETRLRLYGLFKVIENGGRGPAVEEKPYTGRVVALAKYQAWNDAAFDTAGRVVKAKSEYIQIVCRAMEIPA